MARPDPVIQVDHGAQPAQGRRRYLPLRGRPVRGYAYFFHDGTPLAPAIVDDANGQIYVHYNLSQFAAILQLLREEEPVYLYGFDPTYAGLQTGGEPTGEEEGLDG